MTRRRGRPVAERPAARLELDLVAAPGTLERTRATPAQLQRIVAAALDHVGAGRPLLALAIVGDEESADYHERSHGDPRPTDVISVELGEGLGPTGEVVVNAELALRMAGERGVEPARELALYVVHGVLHLYGFDDQQPGDRARMRLAERAILDGLGFAPDLAPHDLGD
jgi:probable rRNA maturation factor